MGVTIHYAGRLRDQAAYRQLMAVAETFAAQQGWKVAPGREGTTRGLIIQPHESSEPVWLEFDGELHVQASTKTQFAPTRIHIEIIELLRAIQPFFLELKVYDEGDYWETGDPARLQSRLDVLNAAMGVLERALGGRSGKSGPLVS